MLSMGRAFFILCVLMLVIPAAYAAPVTISPPVPDFVRYTCGAEMAYWDGASFFSMTRSCPLGTVCLYCGQNAGSPCVFPGDTCESLGYNTHAAPTSAGIPAPSSIQPAPPVVVVPTPAPAPIVPAPAPDEPAPADDPPADPEPVDDAPEDPPADDAPVADAGDDA